MQSMKGKDLLICHEFLGLTNRPCILYQSIGSLACDNFDVESQIMATFRCLSKLKQIEVSANHLMAAIYSNFVVGAAAVKSSYFMFYAHLLLKSFLLGIY